MRQEGRGALHRHLRAARRRLVAGHDPGRFLHAAAARRLRAAGAVVRSRLPAFPGDRARRHQQGDQRARSPSRRTATRWSARCAGLRNYWVACAVMAGFSQGGGIGLVLSRWMAEGDPGAGHPGDGRRPLRRLRDAEIHHRSRCRRTTGGASASPIPNEELPAARPVRRTPIYDRLRRGRRRDGREFRPGECAVVRARPASRPPRPRPIAARRPSPIVRAECQAVRAAVGHLRDLQLRQVRGHRARRARLARPRVRLPHPAGPAGWRSRRC